MRKVSTFILLFYACISVVCGKDSPPLFAKDIGVKGTKWGEKHCYELVRAKVQPAPDMRVAARLIPKTGARALAAILISEKGKVVDVDILQSTGVAKLDELLIDALKNWKFEPLLVNGTAQEIVSLQPFSFTVSQ